MLYGGNVLCKIPPDVDTNLQNPGPKLTPPHPVFFLPHCTES